MDDPKNYRYPKYFDELDWEKYLGFLKETYGTLDPNMVEILKARFPRHLKNPGCLTVHAKVRGELVAIGQIEEDEPHSPIYCSIGSMYADSQYRWNYGFGDFVERLLMQGAQVPGSYFSSRPYTPRATGFVSTVSDAIQRHFQYSHVIGTGLGRLKEDNLVSKPVVYLEKAEWHIAPFMQSGKAPCHEAIETSMEDSQRFGSATCHRVETHPSRNEAYLELLKDRFNAGEIMTDFFFTDRKKWEAIVAFEPSSASIRKEPVGAEELIYI